MIRTLWFIPVAVVALATGLLLRSRHRRHSAALTVDHVSGDWLAHARGREEQEW